MLPYILIIRIHSLIYPVAFNDNDSTSHLTHKIFEMISNPLAQNIVACLLLFFQAVLINRLTIQNRLSRSITLIPGIFYILLCSFLPEYTFLSDYMIANTFLILSISEIMKAYFKPRLTSNIFNSGFFLGLAVLIVPQYFFLMLYGLLAVVVINSLNLLNILQYLSGIITIGCLAFGIEFLLDIDLGHEMGLFAPGFNNFLFSIKTLLTKPVIFLNILFLMSILGYNSYGLKKSIQSQRKIDLLYYFMLSVFISVIFSHDVEIPHMLAMFIPLSILLAMSFLDIKNDMVAEILHAVIVIAIFIIHFNILQLSF